MCTHTRIRALRSSPARHIQAKINARTCAISVTCVKICRHIIVIARRPSRQHRAAAVTVTARCPIRIALRSRITSHVRTQIDSNALTKRIALIKISVVEAIVAQSAHWHHCVRTRAVETSP